MKHIEDKYFKKIFNVDSDVEKCFREIYKNCYYTKDYVNNSNHSLKYLIYDENCVRKQKIAKLNNTIFKSNKISENNSCILVKSDLYDSYYFNDNIIELFMTNNLTKKIICYTFKKILNKLENNSFDLSPMNLKYLIINNNNCSIL